MRKANLKSASAKKPNVIQRKRKENRLSITQSKALAQAWNQIIQTPMSTFITCTIIAITLFLTSSLFVTLKTFQQIANFVNTHNQMTLYLKPDSQNNQIHQWIEELKQYPLIQEVTFISKEQALEELSAQADYKEILSNVSENPLPPVILLKLNSNTNHDLELLINNLRNAPLVASVNVDFDWIKRLSTLIMLMSRLSYALTIIFCVGILLIISHAIQTATQRNQQEIYLLQLIGASVSYIRRPFIYFGSLLGLGAGLITVTLFTLLFVSLKHPLREFLLSYNLNMNSGFITVQGFFAVLTISTLLGLLGSWFAFHRYAKIL